MEGIMKLKNMSKEELELMSYTDLTEMVAGTSCAGRT